MPLIKAEPTREHAEHFVRLAQTAAEGIFSYFFGARADAVLTAMFLQPENENSHEHTYFLQQDGEIAGMIHTYSAADYHTFERRSLWLYIRYSGLQIFRGVWHVFRLWNALSYFGSSLREGDFFIGFLAIYPEYRGRWHSRTMINHAVSLAKNADCERLLLDVHERNRHAISVYLRDGFAQINQSKRFTFDGKNATVWSMAKPLKPAGYVEGSSDVKYSRTTSRNPSGT